jgi:hypothetical protein
MFSESQSKSTWKGEKLMRCLFHNRGISMTSQHQFMPWIADRAQVIKRKVSFSFRCLHVLGTECVTWTYLLSSFSCLFANNQTSGILLFRHFLKIVTRSPNSNVQQIKAGPRHVIERWKVWWWKMCRISKTLYFLNSFRSILVLSVIGPCVIDSMFRVLCACTHCGLQWTTCQDF